MLRRVPQPTSGTTCVLINPRPRSADRRRSGVPDRSPDEHHAGDQERLGAPASQPAADRHIRGIGSTDSGPGSALRGLHGRRGKLDHRSVHVRGPSSGPGRGPKARPHREHGRRQPVGAEPAAAASPRSTGSPSTRRRAPARAAHRCAERQGRRPSWRRVVGSTAVRAWGSRLPPPQVYAAADGADAAVDPRQRAADRFGLPGRGCRSVDGKRPGQRATPAKASEPSMCACCVPLRTRSAASRLPSRPRCGPSPNTEAQATRKDRALASELGVARPHERIDGPDADESPAAAVAHARNGRGRRRRQRHAVADAPRHADDRGDGRHHVDRLRRPLVDSRSALLRAFDEERDPGDPREGRRCNGRRDPAGRRPTPWSAVTTRAPGPTVRRPAAVR